MSTSKKWIVDDPKLVFFVTISKMFLYLIHLLHLFYIKLFSQSETIFTNDEHTILRRILIYLKRMLYIIKSLVSEFKSQISMFFVTVNSK